MTPSAAAGSPSAGAKASILATRAAELSGTAYVAIDGSVSMVESSEWVSLPSEPSAQDLPGLTAHGSWSLSSHGPAAGDFAALSTQELTASIGLDSYAHASARGLADALDGYELVSEEHVTNIYGDPARLIRYRCTIAGVKTEGLDYLVISGRTAAGFTLMTSPARFDAVVAGVMPFISTLRVPADA